MDKVTTIAVIGAGNGGFNLVAHLGAAGIRQIVDQGFG